MKKVNKTKKFCITINVTSKLGTPPNVRTFCGDTFAMRLEDGQDARWTMKQLKTKKSKKKN